MLEGGAAHAPAAFSEVPTACTRLQNCRHMRSWPPFFSPPPLVQLKPTSKERMRMPRQDGQTNLAEAATLSMEFTTLGRITGGRQSISY